MYEYCWEKLQVKTPLLGVKELRDMNFTNKHKLNPLTLKSDQHLISPYKIIPESHIKVMRIKEMITSTSIKFSLSAPQEMYREKYRECTYRC